MSIKTALIGFGKSAQIFHLPLLRVLQDYEVRAVLSSREDEVTRILPQAKVYQDLDSLLATEDLDLVIITTPNHLHYSQAKAALISGKHVVVEKPFVIDVDEGQELIDIAQDRNLKLTVYHNRRWDSGFLTLKKLISEKVLGKIYSYEVRYDRFRPEVQDRWREQDMPGSGIVFDLGAHLIDQAISLFGMPEKIIADIDKQRSGSQSIDYFHILMQYPYGLKVILHSSSLSPAPTAHMLVQGDKAGFVYHQMDSQEAMLKQGLDPRHSDWGLGSSVYLSLADGSQELINTERGAYEDFYKQMSKAILEGASVPVDPSTALDVIRIIEQCKYSAKQSFQELRS